jgi:hypothetical protein
LSSDSDIPRNSILIDSSASGMPVNSGDVNKTCSNDISKETNDVGEELHLFVERPRSLATTCFWHPNLLRRRRAKSAEGMGINCIALFGILFLFDEWWT